MCKHAGRASLHSLLDRALEASEETSGQGLRARQQRPDSLEGHIAAQGRPADGPGVVAGEAAVAAVYPAESRAARRRQNFSVVSSERQARSVDGLSGQILQLLSG